MLAQIWTLRTGRFSVPVTGAEDASRKFLVLQRAEETRTAWGRTLRGGKIYEGTTQIGYVSQNGRVWKGLESDWATDRKPAFDPFAHKEA
ncbi:MAG: hypothetical protein HUU15_12425 [Candidatus Brocadiae bacterium]|nr:hypothetical protein [Candidatus Brocadiia bacterium]